MSFLHFTFFALRASIITTWFRCLSLIDDNGCLRRRWKYKLLVYDKGDHDWGRSWLGLGFWHHLCSIIRSIKYLTLWWDNVSIIIYWIDIESLEETTVPIKASEAHVTLKRDISVLESTGTVKLAIYLVFSSVGPDSALNFIFLVRYEDDFFLVPLFFRETLEDLCAEVVVTSVSTQKPAKSCLCFWPFEFILSF